MVIDAHNPQCNVEDINIPRSVGIRPGSPDISGRCHGFVCQIDGLVKMFSFAT